MSDIRCTICNQSVETCSCAETDARLKATSESPNVMFKWCRRCDRHYARCRCEAPAFYLRSGGQEVPIPDDGFLSLSGQRVIPDLKER
jgi:hypothetical protein